MEPVTTTIVAALIAGAVAASKDVATTAIKDSYQGLKRLISDRYTGASNAVAKVAAKPGSKEDQAELAKQLEHAGVSDDAELTACAQKLLDAISELKSNAAAAPLFDFKALEVARDLKLDNIEAAGAVFRGENVIVKRDFIASNIGRSKKN
jgi:hypothetical protein